MATLRVIYRRLLPFFASLLVLLLLNISGVVSRLTNDSVDILFHLRGEQKPSTSIIIIGVDEKSQESIGPWPFPRNLHGELIDRLSLAQAIGFDFLFTANTQHDTSFSLTIKNGPPVVLAVAHGADGELLLPSPGISGPAVLGHVETLRSGDGIVRKVRLEPSKNLPAFSLALARVTGFSAKHVNRNPLLIHYLGPEKTFLTLSYIDVLSGKYSKDFFSNSIVLVGASDKALGDFHATPFTQHSLASGVEIQANILHNLLTDSFLKKSKFFVWGMALVFITLGLLVWPKRSEAFNCVLNISVFIFISVLSILFFRYGLVVEVTTSLLFLIIYYLFHLLFQVFWMAQMLLEYFSSMEKKIKSNLEHLFHTTPDYLGISKKAGSPRLFPELHHHYQQIQTAGQALDLQYEFIQSILSGESPPLILWEKKTGKVNLTNKGFDELWQNQQQKLHPSPSPDLSSFLDLISEASTEKFSVDDEQLKSPKFHFNIDIHLPDSSGRKKYFRVSLRSFSLANGSFKGVLAGLTDVTEIKEMERIKDEVVSIVSHELKLPLTTIGGYGEILEEMLDGKQKEYAQTICNQTKRLNRLINDFLHINRLEGGRETLNIYPFDMRYVVEESIAAVSYAAKNKNITISTNMPAKVSPLLGDELLLLQAIINILENSIKYSPDETTVLIELNEMEKEIQLSISDEGPGIPVAEQGSIFNKFVRGKQNGSEEGYGLGLSFTHQVISLHRGQIGFDNSTSKGTTVQIILLKKE